MKNFNASIVLMFLFVFFCFFSYYSACGTVLAADCSNWITVANLGGAVKYSPGVMAESDRLVVTAVGSDNGLWANEFIIATGQNEWYSLGGELVSGVSMASDASGKIAASGIGNDNTAWSRTYQSSKNWSEWQSTGLSQLAALGPSQAAIGDTLYRAIKKSDDSVEIGKCASQVCAPNSVFGCKVCKADGSGWQDDDSKCGAEQICQDGTCVIQNSENQTIDLLPYFLKSGLNHDTVLSGYPSDIKGSGVHTVYYAVDNDLSGAHDIDMFHVKFNDPNAFEWWQYRASDQKIYHMYDMAETSDQYRWVMHPGIWIPRFMNTDLNPIDVSSGTITTYGNLGDNSQVDPPAHPDGASPYKIWFSYYPSYDFGGELGKLEAIGVGWDYRARNDNTGGFEEFILTKEYGWSGWKAFTHDMQWVAGGPFSYVLHTLDYAEPNFSCVAPHPYVPLARGTIKYTPSTMPSCQNDCFLNGAMQCQNISEYRTCGDYDADSCLEWSPIATCANGQTCFNGECVITCAPKTCAEYGYVCGSQSNDCGGTLNCGTCAAGKTCAGGQCVASGGGDDAGGSGSDDGNGGDGDGIGNDGAGNGVIELSAVPMTRAEILAKIEEIKALLVKLIQELINVLSRQLLAAGGGQ